MQNGNLMTLIYTRRSHAYDDLPAQIASLQHLIEHRLEQAKALPPEDRRRLSGVAGAAVMHRNRLAWVLAQQRAGRHRVASHELFEGLTWMVCTCGFSARRRDGEELDVVEFLTLAGHSGPGE